MLVKNYSSAVSSSFRRYNVQWYIAPLHIQKLILFLLQRGTKAFENLVIIGGLFVGSLEGFATVKILLEFTQQFIRIYSKVFQTFQENISYCSWSARQFRTLHFFIPRDNNKHSDIDELMLYKVDIKQI